MGPTTGLMVVHLGVKIYGAPNILRLKEACEKFTTDENQLVYISPIGSHSEAIFMLLSTDLVAIKKFQRDILSNGFSLEFSYVSITEVSEYAQFMPDHLKNTRLYPKLPPVGFNSWCFYPMSKRRDKSYNWYLLDYEVRDQLMRSHGKVGRKFAGKVVQLVTGSTGIDDFEWGVTLFAKTPSDLKEVVYEMRYDEASAKYAEFGEFIFGFVVNSYEDLIELNGWATIVS